MPAYAVSNTNFRDEVIKTSYPFDENSTLLETSFSVGTDLFIDASFFLKGDFSLPIRLSYIDGMYGTEEQVKLIFCDSLNQIIGSSILDFTSEEVSVVNSTGVLVGVLAFNLEGLEKFIGQVQGIKTNVQARTAVFSIDTSYVTKYKGPRYLSINSKILNRDIKLVARHRCSFFQESDGSVRLDILGDRVGQVDSTRTPVKSVNGVQNKSVWLQNDARSNLRIYTDNSSIKFAQAKDEK